MWKMKAPETSQTTTSGTVVTMEAYCRPETLLSIFNKMLNRYVLYEGTKLSDPCLDAPERLLSLNMSRRETTAQWAQLFASKAVDLNLVHAEREAVPVQHVSNL